MCDGCTRFYYHPRPSVDALELARAAIERDAQRTLMTAPEGQIEKLREVYDWLEREASSARDFAKVRS